MPTSKVRKLSPQFQRNASDFRVQGAVTSVSLAIQFGQAHSKTDALACQPLDHVGALGKLASVLDRLGSARSLEEQHFGADPGTTSTDAEHIEALIGGGSRVEGAPAARRPGPRAAQSTHLPRVPWNRCDAREESTEGLDDSSLGVPESAATSASPLPALNFTKGHRDGRWIRRRGQIRRVRTSACHIVPELRNTRVRSEGQWPRSSLGSPLLGLTGPEARPDVHWSPAEVLSSLGTGKRPRRRRHRSSC